MIEQVEEVSSELQFFRLGQRKLLANRKIDVALTWPTQHVTSDITDISSQVTGQGRRIMSARDWLAGLHYRRREGRRVEVITLRDAGRGVNYGASDARGDGAAIPQSIVTGK